MALTDLTDTVWKLKDALATYPEAGSYGMKTYNVNIVTSEPILEGTGGEPKDSFENIAIGYNGGSENNEIRLDYLLTGVFQLAYGNDTKTLPDSWRSYFTGTFEITGGSDAENSELIAWFESNCTNVTTPTIVTIKYGNDAIAKMSDSGTKTLKTSGKYLLGDVSVIFNPEPTVWTKPEDWPDLDALELPTDRSENVIYLLYDRKCGVDDVHLRFAGTANIGKGTVDDNEFVGNEVATNVASYADTLSDEYTVYRLSGKFTNFGFDAEYVLANYTMTYQGIVWIRGTAPMLTTLGGSKQSEAMLGIHTQAYELYDTLALQRLTLPERAFYTMPTSRYRVGAGSNGDYNGNTITRTGNGPMFYHFESDSVLTVKNAAFKPNGSSCSYVTRVRFENVTFPNGLVQQRFDNAGFLKSIEFADTCDVECTDMYYQFRNCYLLETCDMHAVDFTSATRSSSAFQYCHSLKDLRLNDTWRMDLNISDCIYMPKSTVIQLFSDLGTIETARTITLPYGLKNYLLTPEEIAVITEKGWTVA